LHRTMPAEFWLSPQAVELGVTADAISYRRWLLMCL
jgi:hypothetical protein